MLEFKIKSKKVDSIKNTSILVISDIMLYILKVYKV